MNRLTLSLCMAVAGLLLSAAPASALTLTATPQNILSSGTYQVNVNQIAPNQWTVTVQGNNDGNTTDGPAGPAKHAVGRISIGFLRSDNTYISPNEVLTNGGTNSGGSYVGAPWFVTAEADVARFNANDDLNDVCAFGANIFSGTITLTSAEAPFRITAALQNGTQQWWAEVSGQDLGGRGDLVPEPVSMALVLPGLLPLALAMRRRRTSA